MPSMWKRFQQQLSLHCLVSTTLCHIKTFPFHKVVQQHISGVVEICTHIFCSKFHPLSGSERILKIG